MINLRAGFNVRKKQILELLGRRAMTAEEVARVTEINERTVRNHLLRYHRLALITRGIKEGHKGRSPYVYTLSRRGRKKLRRIEVKHYRPGQG